MEDSKTESIIQAARIRFGHYGISKTTMNEIAADIGMSKASLYYYFPDKDRLFAAVLDMDMQQFAAAMEMLIQKPSKASFKLKKYVTTRNEYFRTFLNLAKLESSNVSEVLSPAFNEFKVNLYKRETLLIEKILEFGISEGEFNKFNVETYADLFLSALVGLRSSRFMPDLTFPEESFKKMKLQTSLFVTLFLKSIRQKV